MSIEVTPGSRLRDLIEKRGYKMKVFAEITGIVPNTLSKFVNGKPMSDKYIKKAAEVLDVTPEYIKCESDDMTPPRYLQYSKDLPQKEKDANRQAGQFAQMQALLKSMGVDITLKATIGGPDTLTVVRGGYNWMPVEGKTYSWEEEGIDDDSIVRLLTRPGSRVWVDLNFRERKVSLDYADFQRWLRSLVGTIELRIQEKFDLFYDISMRVEDTDIDQALKGEIKDDVPEKNNGNLSKPTEEESLLEEVFGKP